MVKRIKKGQVISIRELTAGGLFTSLIAVGAFIKITLPTEPLPMHFTLQWLFVLLAGLLLDKRIAGTSVWIYLLMGLSGVPVFAAGGGLSYLLRPTFGYLIGFAVAAYLIAWLCEHFRSLGFMKMFLFSLIGLFTYYAIGVLYYFLACRFLISQEITWQILLFNCFLLTLPADFLLCLAAVSISIRVRSIVRAALQT